MAKSKRQLADEAWLRVNTPDNNGALPGQLDIEGQLQQQDDERMRALGAQAPVLTSIPYRCPSCDREQTLMHGWAYSRQGDPPTIQCPRCGARYAVPEEERDKYRAAVKNAYALLPKSPPPAKKKAKKARGAG